jgi:hypothetical protein
VENRVGGLKDEKVWLRLDRAGSLRPLLINTEHCVSWYTTLPRANWSGKTGIIARRGLPPLDLENKTRDGVISAFKRSSQCEGIDPAASPLLSVARHLVALLVDASAVGVVN